MTSDDLSPTIEVCGTLRMSMTEFCHCAGTDAVIKARADGKSDEDANDAYLEAYYRRLATVFPNHPALKDFVP